MSITTTPGVARFVGSAAGVVRKGGTIVEWLGEAQLYHLSPPLKGYSVVVASTVADAPRLSLGGNGFEVGMETFLLGVIGEDLRLADRDELPGSGWGNSPVAALAEAGYQVA